VNLPKSLFYFILFVNPWSAEMLRSARLPPHSYRTNLRSLTHTANNFLGFTVMLNSKKWKLFGLKLLLTK